jgi:glycogen(starch) synthase
MTPYAAHAEPRGPRHAHAWAKAFPRANVLFVDCAPRGAAGQTPEALEGLNNLRRHTFFFPTRQTDPARWLFGKLLQKTAQWVFKKNGRLQTELFAPELAGLRAFLKKTKAQMYHLHKWDVFLPFLETGLSTRGLVFDCMEFYSEMGEGQAPTIATAIRQAESRWLGRCRLLTTSSPEVARAYEAICPGTPSVADYNCPRRVPNLEISPNEPLRLYWRNTVVALSQRGLEEALDALRMIPDDVLLSVQGHLSPGGAQALERALKERRIEKRVRILAPYAVDQAIAEASKFNIGLCLERDVNANHRLTVSNKMFDYHMAGLAVVASDLPSLRNVINQSGGGLLFKAGDASSLAAQILLLQKDRALFQRSREKARAYALAIGNEEFQMELFTRKIKEMFSWKATGSRRFQ